MPGRLRTTDGQEHPIGEALAPIECFRCGVCCMRYQAPVDAGESEVIATALGMSSGDFLSRYGQLTNVGYLLRQSKGDCVFLGREADGTKAACKIYSCRPRACREWIASLGRRECQEGLAKLKAKGKVRLAQELCLSPESSESLSRHPSEG